MVTVGSVQWSQRRFILRRMTCVWQRINVPYTSVKCQFTRRAKLVSTILLWTTVGKFIRSYALPVVNRLRSRSAFRWTLFRDVLSTRSADDPSRNTCFVPSDEIMNYNWSYDDCYNACRRRVNVLIRPPSSSRLSSATSTKSTWLNSCDSRRSYYSNNCYCVTILFSWLNCRLL